MAIPCLGMQIYSQHSSCMFVQILREILLCLQDLRFFSLILMALIFSSLPPIGYGNQCIEQRASYINIIGSLCFH